MILLLHKSKVSLGLRLATLRTGSAQPIRNHCPLRCVSVLRSALLRLALSHRTDTHTPPQNLSFVQCYAPHKRRIIVQCLLIFPPYPPLRLRPPCPASSVFPKGGCRYNERGKILPLCHKKKAPKRGFCSYIYNIETISALHKIEVSIINMKKKQTKGKVS